VAADHDLHLEQTKLQSDEDKLTQEQKEQLEFLIERYEHIFTDKPGKTDIMVHDVDTGTSPPIRFSPYQLAEAWKSQVKQEIQDLVEAGNLVHSVNPWSNPLIAIYSNWPSTLIRFIQSEVIIEECSKTIVNQEVTSYARSFRVA